MEPNKRLSMKSVTQILLFLSFACCGQQSPLRPFSHGLRMVQEDVNKQQLMDELRFENGPDETVNVIRFDHVSPKSLPLVISSKMPIATDSLGIISFRLQEDTLSSFLNMIHHVSPKFTTRKSDGILIRVTYRFKQELTQYYMKDSLITTAFFQIIEDRLISNNDLQALEKYYKFLAPTGLLMTKDRKKIWKYDL
jgi:hypothetical protein